MDLSATQQDEFISQEFKNLIQKNSFVSKKEFNTCTFVKCVLNETQFKNCLFQDCKFKGCELTLASFDGCSFTNTRFEDCRLISIDWTQTSWAKRKVVFKPVDFVDCVLNHSTFLGLNMKKILISKCLAHDVSFEEADLTQANCSFTDFSNSRFLHTNLTEADFTGAKNYEIAANLNTLKKTKFSLPEAMSLLYNLDICLTEYEHE